MRRITIALLLGAWLTGTLLIGLMAAENFWMIDRLLNTPSNVMLRQMVAGLPPGEGHALLWYLASEYNRFGFAAWGWVELALAVVLVALAGTSRTAKKLRWGFAVMLAIVAAMAFWLTPEIVAVGRQLDFVAREPAPPALATFGRLHGAYSILDLGKLLIGFWMAAVLMRSPED